LGAHTDFTIARFDRHGYRNYGAKLKTNKTMKTKTIHLTLALLAGAAATAQEPEGHKGHRPPPVPPLFAIFDEDRDGVLSEQEIGSAADALGKLDRDGDGKITREEMRPPKPDGGDAPDASVPKGPPPGMRPPPPVIAALDADGDGTISAEELKAAPESLKELDENGDGELSPEELHPHGPPPPHESGPQGPPPADGDQEPMEVE